MISPAIVVAQLNVKASAIPLELVEIADVGRPELEGAAAVGTIRGL
jgi:hypothetical protein